MSYLKVADIERIATEMGMPAMENKVFRADQGKAMTDPEEIEYIRMMQFARAVVNAHRELDTPFAAVMNMVVRDEVFAMRTLELPPKTVVSGADLRSIDLRIFGAFGDGGNDDTDAFQCAIEYLNGRTA